MATSAATIEYVLDQLRSIPTVQAKKMFGEYCLYVDGKPVALVCDDTVFLKPTPAGQALLGAPTLNPPALNPPYKGAKPHYEISANVLDDRLLFSSVMQATAQALPEPKPKIAKKPNTAHTLVQAK